MVTPHARARLHPSMGTENAGVPELRRESTASLPYCPAREAKSEPSHGAISGKPEWKAVGENSSPRF